MYVLYNNWWDVRPWMEEKEWRIADDQAHQYGGSMSNKSERRGGSSGQVRQSSRCCDDAAKQSDISTSALMSAHPCPATSVKHPKAGAPGSPPPCLAYPVPAVSFGWWCLPRLNTCEAKPDPDVPPPLSASV